MHLQTALQPRWPKHCSRLRLRELFRPKAASASKRAPAMARQDLEADLYGTPAAPPTSVVAPEGSPPFAFLIARQARPAARADQLGIRLNPPQQPQHHNHEAHHRKKNCRGRARQGRRSQLRIFQQPPKKKNLILLNTRGRQSWCSRVQRSGCRRLTRDRHRCCVSHSRRQRCCEYPRRQHQRKEDPLI